MAYFIEILKTEHTQLTELMNQLSVIANHSDRNNSMINKLFQEFKSLFQHHDEMEDKLIYPELLKHTTLEKLIRKSYQAHHIANMGILELRVVPFISDSWAPKFDVIKDSILSHMKEEEEKVLPLSAELLSSTELQKISESVKHAVEKYSKETVDSI